MVNATYVDVAFYCRDNVMKSLGSLLGVNEITARTFTAQSACDIASRSVEFFQLLERLARDGDAICQALENQAVAQKKLTMTLRLILPHIKAYFAEQQADKQVLEGMFMFAQVFHCFNIHRAICIHAMLQYAWRLLAIGLDF